MEERQEVLSLCGLGFLVSFDVVDGVTDGLDGFCLLVGDGDSEFFFKLHDELYGVKAVSAEVFGEFCGFGNFVFVNTKFVYDNSFNARCNF